MRRALLAAAEQAGLKRTLGDVLKKVPGLATVCNLLIRLLLGPEMMGCSVAHAFVQLHPPIHHLSGFGLQE